MSWFNHSAATARTIGQARAGRPPRSPKLKGAVERDNHTHPEEFYRVTSCFLEMNQLNRELRQWATIYNTVRPHQSLSYLTPQPFLLRTSSLRKE